jgi:hypothetical protein
MCVLPWNSVGLENFSTSCPVNHAIGLESESCGHADCLPGLPLRIDMPACFHDGDKMYCIDFISYFLVLKISLPVLKSLYLRVGAVFNQCYIAVYI